MATTEAPNRIVIVEGDHLQYDQWTKVLGDLPGVQLERIDTESEFVRRIPDMAENPPKVVIAEAMLRWSDPREEDPAPPTPKAIRDGFYWGGVRCLARLAADSRTAQVPQILWTMIERSDLKAIPDGLLPPHAIFISKHVDRYTALRAQVTAYLNPVPLANGTKQPKLV